MGNTLSIEEAIPHWDETDWNSLIDGYIRNYQKHNEYITIPKALIKLVYNYSYQIAMKFDTDLVFEGWMNEPMTFVDDVTVEQINSRIATTCLLCNFPITGAICNEFMFEVMWISTPRTLFMKIGQWYIGYMNAPNGFKKLTDEKDLSYKGSDTVEVYISHGDNRFKLHDGTTEQGAYLSYVASNNFENGDRFALKFNFLFSTITIYHNGSRAAIIPLRHQNIVPALTIYKARIKVTKWMFK